MILNKVKKPSPSNLEIVTNVILNEENKFMHGVNAYIIKLK